MATCPRLRVSGFILIMLGILNPGPELGHTLVQGISFCNPTLAAMLSLKRQGGAVRIKCGKVSRLLSVFEGIQGPKYFSQMGC